MFRPLLYNPLPRRRPSCYTPPPRRRRPVVDPAPSRRNASPPLLYNGPPVRRSLLYNGRPAVRRLLYNGFVVWGGGCVIVAAVRGGEMNRDERPAWLDPSSGEAADPILVGGDAGPEWMEGAGVGEPPPYAEPGSPGYRAALEDVPEERRLKARRYLAQMKEWATASEPGPAPRLDSAVRVAPLPPLPSRRELWRRRIPENSYKPGARPRAFTVQECGPPSGDG